MTKSPPLPPPPPPLHLFVLPSFRVSVSTSCNSGEYYACLHTRRYAHTHHMHHCDTTTFSVSTTNLPCRWWILVTHYCVDNAASYSSRRVFGYCCGIPCCTLQSRFFALFRLFDESRYRGTRAAFRKVCIFNSMRSPPPLFHPCSPS